MKYDFKASLKQMANILDEMVNLVYQGFMENDAHYLNRALNKERVIDDLEKDITANIIKESKGLDKEARKEFVLIGQVSENLERMGDELRYLMERIEIKIAEKLYFSEIGVEQYKEVSEKMHNSVKMAAEFLSQNKIQILDSILENGIQIKNLIEKYRAEHLDRLTQGLCQPRAANIYFDMLDFTGNVARHCTNIARIYKDVK